MIRTFDDPASVTPEALAALREMGWTDNDILDATFHATSMLASSVLFKAFVRA